MTLEEFKATRFQFDDDMWEYAHERRRLCDIVMRVAVNQYTTSVSRAIFGTLEEAEACLFDYLENP